MITAPGLSHAARCELSPNMLWPPNHKMRTITATVTTNLPPELVTVVLAEIVSNEPDNGEGDGNTIDDIQGHDIGNTDFEFELRAERSGYWAPDWI